MAFVTVQEEEKIIAYSLFVLTPHCAKNGPSGVACDPRYAVVSCSPTNDQPPPREERDAVVIPCSRKIRN